VPVFRLDSKLVFPPPSLANDNGLLAVGGDLSPERLVLAYRSGIFPWYDEGLPILWHSPDPRYVLVTSQLHVPKSLAKQRKRELYSIRFDTRFEDVIRACGETKRPGQRGTWITDEMTAAYVRLFELGVAHSAEAFDETGRLVGGLYGVSLGTVFFGESIFARAPDASKIAFVTMVEALDQAGVTLVDCQVHTEHLERFGAEFWPRTRYLRELARRVEESPHAPPFATRTDAARIKAP